MIRRAAALALLALGGCVTPLEQGEALYRQGDARGALEIWRAVPEDDADGIEVSERVAQVEAEFAERARAYQGSAAQREHEGRLAEALLDHRLALALEPEDATGWAHVQQLAREFASRKAELTAEYRGLRAAGDLQGAQVALVRLRTLDPFEAEFEIEERQLQTELVQERVRRKAELSEQYRQQLALGDLQAARASLLELRTLDPFDTELDIEERQLEAGLALQWRKDRVRARGGENEEEVEQLIEAGRTAFAEERLETALVLWRQARRIDPRNERVRAYIEHAERELQRLDELRELPDVSSP
jgi:tetratricopeptide (TPR) repeat protein